MKFYFNKKVATSIVLISILTLQPTISFAKENPISNFFTKMFSSKSSKTNQTLKTQIFKTDVNSLNIKNLKAFKNTIQDILKNFLDKKTVNTLLNNISYEVDKNLDANNLDQFDNFLPKSNTDKIKGPVLIRIANKLSKDEKTTFEIKKKILFQISNIYGIRLALQNITTKSKTIVVTDKEKTKTKSTSSTMGWVAGLGGVGLAGGGGGGGGGSSSSSLTASDFETTEYNKQYGLGSINASTAYARGYTGSGITVSVLDTPYDTDHPDLVNVFDTGYDGSSGGSDVTCTGSCTTSHGTHVSGIIAANKDNTEMHGIAYNAKIKPITIFNSSGVFDVTTSQLVNSINAGSSSSITAMNNSWGSSTTATINVGGTNYYYAKPATSSLSSSETTAWQNAVGTTVVVWANGNDGLNNSTGRIYYYNSASKALAGGNDYSGSVLNSSSLNVNTPSKRGSLAVSNSTVAGKWLTVVAVDNNNNIASYSNGCGTAKAFCIAAPGSSIYSTIDLDDSTRSGSYATFNGTSMAAPHVTAALAILKQQFPNLTPTQLVSLVTSTATDLGTSGNDEVYGVGLLNLSAATTPSGMSFIAANNANISQATTNNTYIRSSSVFGNAFHSSNLEVGILDSYQRAYIWNPVQDNSYSKQIDVNNYLDQFRNENITRTDVGPNSYFNYTNSNDNFVKNNNLKFSYQEDNLIQSISMLKNYQSFYLNTENIYLLPKFTHIYSNFDSMTQYFNELQLTNETMFLSNIALGKTNEGNKIHELSVSYKYLSDGFTSKISFGEIKEKNNFLGAGFSGAYDLSDQTNSSYLSFNSENSITPNIIFNTNYMKMISKNSFTNSSFANISDVKSDTMKIGVSFKNIFEKSDKVNLNYKKPLAVINGSLNQSTVKGYNSDGDYNSVNERYSLVNNARQETISIGYNSNLEENLSFFSTLHLTENWNNKKNNDNYGILAGFKVNF